MKRTAFCGGGTIGPDPHNFDDEKIMQAVKRLKKRAIEENDKGSPFYGLSVNELFQMIKHNAKAST